MQIYIARHEQSIDNKNGVIQGPNHNSSLTKKGQQDAKRLADKLYDELSNKNITQIVSSPLERARQTALIVADKLKVPVVYDPSIVEVNPGIIAGPKEHALSQYPEYLKIWNQRKDLDGIPNAETGDELQARALYFLERYLKTEKNFKEVVISHAGFNRVLINTARLKQRDQSIGHQHAQVHMIKDPWQKIEVESLPLAKASQAYKVKTIDQQYVLKKIFGAVENEMLFQNEVSAHVAQGKELLSEILYWGMKQDYSVQVLRFLEGNHIYGEISQKQKQNLLLGIYELGKRLKTVPENLRTLHGRTLKDKVEESILNLGSSSIKEKGMQLLKDPRYIYLVTEVPQVVVHYDLHRSNILSTKDNEIRILDLGSMIYAPEEFLAASLFMSFFMLEQGENCSLKDLLQSWPNRLNKKDILILMQARTLIGVSFFERKLAKSKYIKEDYNIYQKYLNVLDVLERY